MKYNVVASIDAGQAGTTLPFLVDKTPVWKLRLWTEEQFNSADLPFFEVDPDWPSSPVNVGTVVIDGERYTNVQSWQECFRNEKTWFIDEEKPWFLYIHFAMHRPPASFFFIQWGVSYLFSLYQIKNSPNMLPILTNTATLHRSADLLEYNKIRLPTISFDLNNSYKDMDDFPIIFGFNMSLHAGPVDKEFAEYHHLARFIVSEYSRGINSVTIHGRDKRESWSQKAPNAKMIVPIDPKTGEPAPNRPELYEPGRAYPFLGNDKNYTMIPDAYGYCFQVEGICLNENEALTSRWRHFKFARDITSHRDDGPFEIDNWGNIVINGNDTDRQYPFILEAEIGQRWVRLPRNFQEFQALGYGGEDEWNAGDTTSGNSPGHVNINTGMLEIFVNGINKIYTDNWSDVQLELPDRWRRVNFQERGVVSIPVIWAHNQDNQLRSEDTMGGINKVRLTAFFVNTHPDRTQAGNTPRSSNPGNVIRDLLSFYGGVLPTRANYVIDEWHAELDKLNDIGVYLGTEKPCLDWVRDIQNMSILGFQTFVSFQGITARVANPNRAETFHIGLNTGNPILNKDAMRLRFGSRDYATYTEVEFAFREEGGQGDRVTDERWRLEMISRHMYDKTYFNSSRMRTREEAELKAYAIMQQYHNELVVLENIELHGDDNFDIWPYDTGWIDPDEVRRFFPNESEMIRIIVTDVRISPATGRTILSVGLCKRINGLPPDFG